MTYATNSTSAVAFTACGWCGDALAHGPGACRAVKSVEYYPDGTLKRVEKFTDVELRHATAEVGTLLARSALLR